MSKFKLCERVIMTNCYPNRYGIIVSKKDKDFYGVELEGGDKFQILHSDFIKKIPKAIT